MFAYSLSFAEPTLAERWEQKLPSRLRVQLRHLLRALDHGLFRQALAARTPAALTAAVDEGQALVNLWLAAVTSVVGELEDDERDEFAEAAPGLVEEALEDRGEDLVRRFGSEAARRVRANVRAVVYLAGSESSMLRDVRERRRTVAMEEFDSARAAVTLYMSWLLVTLESLRSKRRMPAAVTGALDEALQRACDRAFLAIERVYPAVPITPVPVATATPHPDPVTDEEADEMLAGQMNALDVALAVNARGRDFTQSEADAITQTAITHWNKATGRTC